jgi:hypothetical protein
MKDTILDLIQAAKGTLNDPVPYVNTAILFGLSALEWDLLFKIILGAASVIWTVFRILNEMKKYRNKSTKQE